jgi:dihydrofolate reductase
MEGGTTFHFVTKGIEAALEMAQTAAAGKDVAISGGAGVAKQYLAAGLVDELTIDLVPVLLGGGVRLFDFTMKEACQIKQVAAVHAPRATHLMYEIAQ